MSREELQSWLRAPNVSPLLNGAEDITPPEIRSALGPVWLAVFDDTGKVIREERGESALLIKKDVATGP